MVLIRTKTKEKAKEYINKHRKKGYSYGIYHSDLWEQYSLGWAVCEFKNNNITKKDVLTVKKTLNNTSINILNKMMAKGVLA